MIDKGATVNKVSDKDAFDAWLAHHYFSARMSLQKIIAEPWSCAMTAVVMGIALALPASLLLLVENVKNLSGRWEGHPQISVYVRQTASPAATLLVEGKLKAISGVKSVRYVSPEAGLETFKQYSGFGDALKWLDQNPLPAVYVIAPTNYDVSEMNALALQIRTFPEVDFVQLDLAWVKKLQQIMQMAERFILVLGSLLCLGALFTVGNTVRLAIENRREEMVVVKLMGATDAYVRRPLLYSGLWFGLMGGVMACLFVLVTMHLLSAPAQQLALLYQSAFKLMGLGWLSGLVLVLSSAFLGLTGAWLAIARHLTQIQPR